MAWAKPRWGEMTPIHTAPTPMACNGCTHVRSHPIPSHPIPSHPTFLPLRPFSVLSPSTSTNNGNSKGGGMQSSKNRTLWPVGGGAVGFQPGWFSGHASAFLYINLGDGTLPENFSMIMQPVFEITGPQNTIYPGSICLPHVSLPVNYTAVIGHNATIQVIELAQHGAALYNVSPSPPSRHQTELSTIFEAGK